MTDPTPPLVPRRFEVDGARGLRYVELSPGTREKLAEWLRAGSVAGGEELKPGRVYRWEDWVVKLFDFGGMLRDHLRPSLAVRSARRHAQLQAMGTPRPIATLERPRGRSLMVLERIDGPFLHEVIARGEDAAVAAFPAFMADMHRRRVFHGDLHLYQMIWGGARWFLLDLDGLRHRLRTLRVRPLIEDQWARLYFGLGHSEVVPTMFRRYLGLARPDPRRAASWERVLERERWLRELRA
ncbi:MAG: hypothetical protein O7B99_09635 [Planctomycetota bacterium]|nr:hypothetical protein [Planctomycetota bacterium]